MLDEVKNGFMRVLNILMSTSRLTYASIGVGLLVAFLYFKLFFQNVSQFGEDAKNTGKLEYMRSSLFFPFRWLSDWTDFQWSELKIIIWIGLSVGSGILAYYQLPEWFPNLFR